MYFTIQQLIAHGFTQIFTDFYSIFISVYPVRHEALKIPVGGNPSRVIGLSLGR